MADRIRDDDLDGIRLDSIRMLINCSEPVRAESHDRFYGRFAPTVFGGMHSRPATPWRRPPSR
jgi:hypothetical protein